MYEMGWRSLKGGTVLGVNVGHPDVTDGILWSVREGGEMGRFKS